MCHSSQIYRFHYLCQFLSSFISRTSCPPFLKSTEGDLQSLNVWDSHSQQPQPIRQIVWDDVIVEHIWRMTCYLPLIQTEICLADSCLQEKRKRVCSVSVSQYRQACYLCIFQESVYDNSHLALLAMLSCHLYIWQVVQEISWLDK